MARINRNSSAAATAIVIATLIWVSSPVSTEKPVCSSSTVTTDGQRYTNSDNASSNVQSRIAPPRIVKTAVVDATLSSSHTITPRDSAEYQDETSATTPSRSSEVILLPPHLAYNKYIGEAEAGSADAQLYISTILGRCSGISIRTREDLEPLQGRLPDAYFLELRRTYRDCKKLYKTLAGADLKKMRRLWLEKSVDGGSLIAKLQSQFESPLDSNLNPIQSPGGGPERERVLPLLYRAFELAKGDPLLQDKTYTAALDYYGHFIQSKHREGPYLATDDYKYGVERDAWDYLWCKHSFSCSTEEWVERMAAHYHEDEIHLMMEKADTYTQAIARSDWQALGLEDDSNRTY